MHISDEKQQLRNAIKERLDRLDEGKRLAEGRTLSRVLLKKLPHPVTLCGYFPLKSEVDIRLLLQEAQKRGDRIFLPRFEDNTLRFREALDFDALVPGAFTIPEPPITAPLLRAEEAEIVLVPARAYDRTGKRLGRGNGGYDIWIGDQRRKNPRTLFWGVCLECQLVTRVPMEAHDQTVDAVITASEWIDCAKK